MTIKERWILGLVCVVSLCGGWAGVAYGENAGVHGNVQIRLQAIGSEDDNYLEFWDSSNASGVSGACYGISPDGTNVTVWHRTRTTSSPYVYSDWSRMDIVLVQMLAGWVRLDVTSPLVGGTYYVQRATASAYAPLLLNATVGATANANEAPYNLKIEIYGVIGAYVADDPTTVEDEGGGESFVDVDLPDTPVYDTDWSPEGYASSGLTTLEIGTLGVLSGWGGATPEREVTKTVIITFEWFDGSPLKALLAAAMLGFAAWQAVLMPIHELKKSGGSS